MVLKMAMRSIGANKMRSLLTMLGIIIGVVSLVVLVSLVSSTTNSITNSVSGLGTSLITASISDDKGHPIHMEDLETWIDQEPTIGAITPVATCNISGRYGAENEMCSVNGVTSDYAKINGLNVLEGRFLKRVDNESASYVCVLSRKAAEELIGYVDCIGAEISIGNTKYKVVGVLENEDSLEAMLMYSMTVYIPYNTLVRTTDNIPYSISTFYASAAENHTVAQAESRIKDLLRERFKDSDAYYVSSQNIFEDTMRSVTSVLKILLGGIAAISLIVGGVGIMNIMLVTVTERTREIGIRKAIGASRRTILVQFIIEAVVLCMLGCALGVFSSWAILQIISLIVANTGLSFKLEASVVAVSAIFCFVIGIVFGLYPANKAARMKPIDALHYGG